MPTIELPVEGNLLDAGFNQEELIKTATSQEHLVFYEYSAIMI